ncbi:MAG: carboxypeptidase regulatory-like domain-containing protein, partial [Terriglobia bacterium]
MKTKTLAWIPLVLLLAVFAAASTLQAQVIGGTFTGEVRDTTGAVIPEAKVSIKNIATGVQTTYTTTGKGVYFAPSLIPGRYLITAEKEGFKRQVLGPVTLSVAQTVPVDLTLAVGATTQTVQVKASGAELLQTETGEISQVIGNTEITQMPLNGRNYQQLVMLTAGVSPGSPGETGAGSAPFNIDGQRDKGNLWTIDGSTTSLGVTGRSPITLPLDAVQEFSVDASSYSAEYGDVEGGVVNVQVKSGTNNWHGDGFEFLRNDALDASDFFSNASHLPKNELRMNQFGGSVGGPIKRDKTFLFATYEGDRNITGAPGITTVPLAAQRAGDFSAPGLPAIYDPTSDLGPAGPGVFRTQFPS